MTSLVTILILSILMSCVSETSFQQRFQGLSCCGSVTTPEVPIYTGRMIQVSTGIEDTPYLWQVDRAVRNGAGNPAGYSPKTATEVQNKLHMEVKNGVYQPHSLKITTTLPKCELVDGVYVPVRLVHLGVKLSVNPNDNGNEEWIACTETGGYSFGVVGGTHITSDNLLTPTVGDAVTSIVATYNPNIEGTGENTGKYLYTIYQDGEQIGSTFLEFTGRKQVLYVDFDSKFTGHIKEVVYWKQGLSSDEVLTEFTPTQLPGPSTHYELEGDSMRLIGSDIVVPKKGFEWDLDLHYKPMWTHTILIEMSLRQCSGSNKLLMKYSMEAWRLCTGSQYRFGLDNNDYARVASDKNNHDYRRLDLTEGDETTVLIVTYNDDTGSYRVYQDGKLKNSVQIHKAGASNAYLFGGHDTIPPGKAIISEESGNVIKTIKHYHEYAPSAADVWRIYQAYRK